MNPEATNPLTDLLASTSWDLAGYCAHYTADEKAAMSQGGEFEFWAYSEPLDDGVQTCILSMGVLEMAYALAPDLAVWGDMEPVRLRVG